MDDVQLAEQALVAALALEPGRAGEVSGWLSPADFGGPAAGLLFARLLELDAAGRREPDALPDLLRCRGELRADGYPVSALLRWLEPSPAPAHVAAYGRLVVEGAVARQLQAAGVRLGQIAVGGRPARSLSTVRLQRALLTAARRRLTSLPGTPIEEAARAVTAAGIASSPPLRPEPVPLELAHAELVTAGAVLVSPVGTRVSRWLTPSDFSSREVGEVFGVAVAMRSRSRPVDRVTVAAELRARGSAVGADLVARCETAVPVATSVGYYGRRVLAASVQRQVGAAGVTLAALGEQRPGGTVAAVDAALAALDALSPLSCRLRMAHASATRTSAVASGPTVARTVVLEPARR